MCGAAAGFLNFSPWFEKIQVPSKTHFSVLMNEVFGIADRRMEGNMSDLQVGPDNISTAFEDG